MRVLTAHEVLTGSQAAAARRRKAAAAAQTDFKQEGSWRWSQSTGYNPEDLDDVWAEMGYNPYTGEYIPLKEDIKEKQEKQGRDAEFVAASQRAQRYQEEMAAAAEANASWPPKPFHTRAWSSEARGAAVARAWQEYQEGSWLAAEETPGRPGRRSGEESSNEADEASERLSTWTTFQVILYSLFVAMCAIRGGDIMEAQSRQADLLDTAQTQQSTQRPSIDVRDLRP